MAVGAEPSGGGGVVVVGVGCVEAVGTCGVGAHVATITRHTLLMILETDDIFFQLTSR